MDQCVKRPPTPVGAVKSTFLDDLGLFSLKLCTLHACSLNRTKQND